MRSKLLTSSDFACVTASGTDWRDIGRNILESLESVRTPDDEMDIGFVYATDQLGGDITSLLSLLKNVTRIKAWYGATGAGICGNGRSLAGLPAAVVMIGRGRAQNTHPLNVPPDFQGVLNADTLHWMNGQTHGVVGVLHGLLCAPAVDSLVRLRDDSGIFSAGGFAGGRQGGLHIAHGHVVADAFLSGVLMGGADRILVSTAQGCVPTGPVLSVTGCRDNLITSLNDEPAFDVLRQIIEKIKLPPIMLQGEQIPSTQERRGHIHAAFPVKGVDTGASLVRNITQADEESKTLSVAHNVSRGDALQFVYRDPHTALDGLARSFQDLRDRAIRQHPEGKFEPKALLHFGCGARLPDLMTGDMADEAALAQQIFGPIPMCGFYTAAEICNGHVYGYTGVSILMI